MVVRGVLIESGCQGCPDRGSIAVQALLLIDNCFLNDPTIITRTKKICIATVHVSDQLRA